MLLSMLTVQWMGGPFDGTWERVEDDATTYAVAFDRERQRVQLPGLQGMLAKKGAMPKHPAVHMVKVITVYTIDPESKHILYRENPPI